jgi:hypothetical protein
MTPRASYPIAKQRLSPHQPYTAPFLARLSAFILHAPCATVEASLRPIPTRGGEVIHIDPNSDALRPTQFINAMCQRLLRLLNQRTLSSPHTDHPSPDTIPFALCLLSCYRAASTSPSQRDDACKYEYATSGESGLVTIPITHPAPRSSSRPQVSDATLIAMSVPIAYKFLSNDVHVVNLQRWALPLELSTRGMVEGERHFLRTVDYAVWVQQEEFLQCRGRLDGLWDGVFRKAVRPAPPAFVTRMFGGRG